MNCFQKSDGEFNVKDLRHTDDPTGKVTTALDKAIYYINNPQKKVFILTPQKKSTI